MRLRQLREEDAIHALQSWQSLNTGVLSVSELHKVQLRLSAAMHARMPLWHVIVESLGDSTNHSGRRKSEAVSTYFMQNLDELRELARQCLVDFLDEDKPDELEEAIRNPQFQDWAYQWYLQSEDLSDIRSVRYICRLPGCNVLVHCIRNDFCECCKLLLSKFSDRTAAKKWLILAEPLRVFNQFEANCFHEAAYCGSSGCLAALVAFAKEQGISWKDLTDKNGKTPLDIAKSQVEKKKEGAVPTLCLLQQEYGIESSDVQLDGDLAQEGVLIASLARETDGKEIVRKQYTLTSATTSWSDLVALSHQALQELKELKSCTDEKVLLLLWKMSVEGNDTAAMKSFFELWLHASSLSFFKCKFAHPAAATSLVTVVTELVDRDEVRPQWERLYIFQCISAGAEEGSKSCEPETVQAKRELAEKVKNLCEVIVRRPSCPLWRLDPLPASILTDEDRHVPALLKASLDVKGCVRLLRGGILPYRFFWTRLTWVERRMSRMQMLNHVELEVRDALDPCSYSCIVGCAKLWLAALHPKGSTDAKYWVREGGLGEAELKELFLQLESALCGALTMSGLLPGLLQELRRSLQETASESDFLKLSQVLRHADSEVPTAALHAIDPVATSSRKGTEKDPAEASKGKGASFKGKSKEKGKAKEESKGKGKRRW
ncbi:unnamed protein product [Symbiodinium sp. CCMP2592]|nr:unnamed protein product [Symbiodinium sp. CCMP2592]